MKTPGPDRKLHDSEGVDSGCLLADYFEGRGCKCSAHHEGECACEADWTPKIEKLVKLWHNMSPYEMDNRLGGITKEEGQTVRHVMSLILQSAGTPILCAKCGVKDEATLRIVGTSRSMRTRLFVIDCCGKSLCESCHELFEECPFCG